ncbi:MAG TPA: mannose-1-phosphate guanylyltransferase [Kiritimatiellia bacterium]|nr:mannose-1-phosphate guanylyltransferase [Kiritimatiellia bacterium]
MSETWYAVVLAGGKGERFWPLSTGKRPKQLLDLVGERPMLAQAVERLEGLIPPERVFIVTNRDLVEATRLAVPEVPAEQVIGEPVGRDTAAAVALGTALVKARDPEASFCILTADHVIGELDRFRVTLRECLRLAEKEEVLITIGIRPTEPSTGYGYIDMGDPVRAADGIEFFKARRFVEKPDAGTAQRYLEAGHYVWNSGMFIWSVRSIETAFRRHRPGLAELIDALAAVAFTPAFGEELDQQFAGLEKISVDYAIMEKSDNILVAKSVFTWDDVGAWPALSNHFAADASENTLIGSCEALDSGRNIVYSKGHLTALVGVDDLIVVQAPGVTLICPREKAQDIKILVADLRSKGGYEEVL